MADGAIKAMKEAEDNKKWDPKQWNAICMDLQQTQPVPRLSIGPAYYKRKLSLYTFCIYDLKKKNLMCTYGRRTQQNVVLLKYTAA